jgi:enoyl-CoA hydratase/carnithine racemase
MTRITVRVENEVPWIGLNRPAKRNAIDVATSDELSAVLDQARKAPCILIVH